MVIYEATSSNFKKYGRIVKNIDFGELKLETGYCAGHNSLLNAVEYHRSSEVNVAATDCILLLGSQQDITDDFQYDTSKIEAFHIRKGTAVELYATTLHYAPCGIENDGFMVGVILPYGTNFDLEEDHIDCLANSDSEDKLLTAKNKWLIAHPDAPGEKGHFPGLIGANIEVNVTKKQMEEI